MDNLILVDTSYTSFYRFFATLKWLSLADSENYKKYKDDPTYNWLDNKVFIDKYEKMYLESIIKLVGKKLYNKSKIIFCMDTPREGLWRYELSSKYKADRIDLSKKNNYKQVFEYTYSTIIPNIIKNNNNISKIRIEKLEADDVIAIICKHYEETNINKNIYLISGDQDFLQLGRDNLFFINYKNKKSVILTKEQAKLALHKKIVLGDKSDSIDTVFPKKGLTANQKKELSESPEKFIEYMKTNKLIETKYNENKKLIDFDFIPKKYIKLVIECL